MTDTLATTNPQPDLKKLQQTPVAGTITLNSIDDLQRLGQILSQSGFFEDCKQASQAVVKILAGSELGFPAFCSMVGIHIIKGKPAIGANLIAAAIKRSGRYDYRVVELSDRVCKIAFFECSKQIGVSEFSASDAAKAGTQNMGKFPRSDAVCSCHFQRCEVVLPRYFFRRTSIHPRRTGSNS